MCNGIRIAPSKSLDFFVHNIDKEVPTGLLTFDTSLFAGLLIKDNSVLYCPYIL